MVRHGLAALDHAFHEVRTARPVVVPFAVEFALALRTRGAADGDVLQAPAEAAHRVALEVRENDHGVVVEKVLADMDFLQPLAALDRQSHVAVFIHDVDGREGPAVRLQDFAVTRRRLTGTRVEDVAFHDRGGNFRLEGLHPFARNDVGTVRFARVKLERGAAGDVAVHELVELQKARGGEVLREVDLRASRAGGGRPLGGRFGGLERRRLQTSRHGRDGGEEITTTQHDFSPFDFRFARHSSAVRTARCIPVMRLRNPLRKKSSDPLEFLPVDVNLPVRTVCAWRECSREPPGRPRSARSRPPARFQRDSPAFLPASFRC